MTFKVDGKTPPIWWRNAHVLERCPRTPKKMLKSTARWMMFMAFAIGVASGYLWHMAAGG